MTNADTSKTLPEMTEIMDRSMRLAETQWRAWGDLESFGTLYRMGFDAWRNWTEIQLAMLDACWKMSCLSLDVPAQMAGTRPNAESESQRDPGKVPVRLKKVAAS